METGPVILSKAWETDCIAVVPLIGAQAFRMERDALKLLYKPYEYQLDDVAEEGGSCDLNSRDRVLKTLEHEEPDRVPLTDHIYMPRSLEGVLGRQGVRVDTPEEYVEVHRVLGLDLIAAFPASFPMAQVGKGIQVDQWGIKWKVVDDMSWYLEGTFRTRKALENFVIPNPDEDSWCWPTEEIVRLVGGDLAIGAVVGGPFTQSWSVMGFQTFVRMLYTDQKLVHRFTEKITRFFIELGKGLIDCDIDVIWIADDMGYVHGPMLSPELFREFVVPHLRKMVSAFKNRGVKVLMHNDGQLMSIMDDLIDTGIDAIHPVERAAGMDLKRIRDAYGEKLTLIGNVDSKTVLQYGPSDDIQRQVLECLSIGAPGGGYILASDHSIHEGIPSANAKCMFEIARKYGKYQVILNR